METNPEDYAFDSYAECPDCGSPVLDYDAHGWPICDVCGFGHYVPEYEEL